MLGLNAISFDHNLELHHFQLIVRREQSLIHEGSVQVPVMTVVVVAMFQSGAVLREID